MDDVSDQEKGSLHRITAGLESQFFAFMIKVALGLLTILVE